MADGARMDAGRRRGVVLAADAGMTVFIVRSGRPGITAGLAGKQV
jgi:hypothetical protein